MSDFIHERVIVIFSKFFALFSTAVCLSVALVATPAQVILLRHAEKPSSGDSLDHEGRMVMICWEHDNLGNIASAFGVKNAP